MSQQIEALHAELTATTEAYQAVKGLFSRVKTQLVSFNEQIPLTPAEIEAWATGYEAAEKRAATYRMLHERLSTRIDLLKKRLADAYRTMGEQEFSAMFEERDRLQNELETSGWRLNRAEKVERLAQLNRRIQFAQHGL